MSSANGYRCRYAGSARRRPRARAVPCSFDDNDLFFADVESQLLVWDLRQGAGEPLTVLTGLQRQLYLACDACRTLDELTHIAADATTSTVSREEAVEEVLAPLVDRGLMVRDGNSFLSLAIPLGEYSPSETILERFYRLVDTIGTTTNGITILPRSSIGGIVANVR